MPSQEKRRVPKTELILTHIAEHGPETEYDLYKRLPKLSHGTIHYCLKKLTERALITCAPSKRGERRKKKLYQLTFMGTVSYLSSFFPWSFGEPTDSEMAEFWERFDEEIQGRIVAFLEKQGRLLKYAPFQEVRWLLERYPGIVRAFLFSAESICNNPPLPLPYTKPFVAAAIHAIEEGVSKKEPTIEEKDYMHLEDKAFRREFTDLFFQAISVMKPKGKTKNNKLRRLAEEELEAKRSETRSIEYAVKLFSK